MANYLRRDTARKATAEKHHRAGSFSGTAPPALLKPFVHSPNGAAAPLTGRFWRIYTDASSKPNAKSNVRFSGWGARIENPEGVGQSYHGAVPDYFTIDDAELCAIIKAIEILPRHVPALIVTDSSKAFLTIRDRHLYLDDKNEQYQAKSLHRQRLIELIDSLLKTRTAPLEINWFAAHQIDQYDVKSIAGLAEAAKALSPEALRMALGNATADEAAALGAERALLRFLSGDFAAGNPRAFEKMESLIATSGWVRDKACAWLRGAALTTEIDQAAMALLLRHLWRSAEKAPIRHESANDLDVAI